MPPKDESGLAFDTAFFTYKPLSNLPTPPPSYRDHSAGASPRCDGAWDGKGQLANHYRGPAIHLVNLIPSAASLVDASASLVQTILTRAGLPLETVALTACILDSLNSRFARKWRLTCPLRASSPAASPCPDTPTTKRHSLPSAEAASYTSSRDRPPQLHIDSVSPEVIVLAALVIAVKFTEDPEQASFFYCQEWGLDIWSSEQLNASERCIMENLNYRILPLCDDELIRETIADMEMAGAYPTPGYLLEATPPASDGEHDDSRYQLGHGRSKTIADLSGRFGGLGLGLGWAS